MSRDPRSTKGDPGGSGKSYLRGYLRIAPAALAVWRSIEARHLATVELPRPILDLGCGFGEFASVFFDEPLDAGIDVRRPDLVRAREEARYTLLALADARQMPFLSERFASVISISVLEHIPRTNEAVAEAYRVLKKGGTFVFTAPTPKLSEFLFYTRSLKRVGLSPLGRLYATLLNRAFHHVSLLSGEEWLRLLEGVGFQVERHQMTIGHRALRAFDLTLPFALPSQMSRLLLGGRGFRRPEWLVNFWERRLARYVEEDEDDGCNLFVVARKP